MSDFYPLQTFEFCRQRYTNQVQMGSAQMRSIWLVHFTRELVKWDISKEKDQEEEACNFGLEREPEEYIQQLKTGLEKKMLNFLALLAIKLA